MSTKIGDWISPAGKEDLISAFGAAAAGGCMEPVTGLDNPVAPSGGSKVSFGPKDG